MTTETRRFPRFRLLRRPRTAAETERVMTLTAHLAELRTRILISVAAVAVGAVFGLVYYNDLFNLLIDPYNSAAADLELEQILAIQGIAKPLVFQLQVAGVAGIILSSPVWLYQLWSFVTPGLHQNERKWAVVFSIVAGPLFIAGAALAYFVLPMGIRVLLNFTPEGVVNLNEVSEYLSFVLRLLLVFGVAFELPVFVVLLNFAGVVSGERLGRWRRGAIFGIFVFAAVATPTGDPITMLLLAVPMWVLFEIAVVICKIHDRRKGGEPGYDQWSDDEQSPL